MLIHYEEPEQVKETYTEQVRLSWVRRGDVLPGGEVREIIRGHKFITLKDAKGRVLLREPIESDWVIEVERERETEESREARVRAMKNNDIVRALVEYETDWIATRNDFIGELNDRSFGRVRYEYFDSLLKADARKQLWDGFAHVVECAQSADHELYGADHVTLYERYCDYLKEQVFAPYQNGPLSRSTSHMSNLQDDVLRHAKIEFVTKGLSYYW